MRRFGTTRSGPPDWKPVVVMAAVLPATVYVANRWFSAQVNYVEETAAGSQPVITILSTVILIAILVGISALLMGYSRA